MNIFIRVDVAKHIGTGHFQRCLTLARKLRSRGHDIYFFLRDYNDGVIKSLLTEEFSFEVIGCSYIDDQYVSEKNWLTVSEQEDARDFLVATYRKEVNPDFIIVDHYSLSSIWEKEVLSKYDVKLMVIDDLANRHHNCDLLVDQNYYHNFEKRYERLVTKNCELLLGPQYSILREEFLDLRSKHFKFQKDIVLVNFGGIGKKEIWDKFIPALQATSSRYNYYVVTGKLHHDDYNIVKSELERAGIKCCQETSHMAELMAHSIYAIGACGSTVWERFCLGLNSTIIDIADNQKELVSFLSEKELIDYLGCFEDLTSEEIMFYFMSFELDDYKYDDRQQKIMTLVDGLGVSRIVSQMELINCKA